MLLASFIGLQGAFSCCFIPISRSE